MILVFDIGTTVIKGGIIDEEGTLVSHSRLPITSPPHIGTSHAGTSIKQWISLFTAVSKQCLGAIGTSSLIQAVVVSGNGPTFIPVNTAGTPLGDALSWANKESKNYIEELENIITEKVNPAFYLSKAYFLFKSDYDTYKKVRWFLPCPEYFSFYLTGNACTILPTKEFTRYMWTKEAIEQTGMDVKKFPPFVQMGEEIGKVSIEGGNKTGIPPGLPVFAGGPDFILTLLGTSTIEPGRICDRTGTSEGINMCSEIPGNDDTLFSTPHIKPELFNISCILPFAGKIGDWFLKLTGKAVDEYRKLYSLVGQLPPGPGKLVFLPHLEQFQSRLWSGYRKGIFVGLTLNHKQEHIFKAIIEGLGYAVREVFDLFESKGFSSDVVRVSGIQASYKEWNTIRAHILGKMIRVPVVWDTELIGAACIGFTSCGRFSDIFEASEYLVHFHEDYLPDKDIYRRYTDMYYMYKELYSRTDSILQDLV